MFLLLKRTRRVAAWLPWGNLRNVWKGWTLLLG